MERVALIFQGRGLAPKLLRSEQTSVEVIQAHSRFVFGTSTWEHGALNPFFRPLLKEIKKLDLSGKQAAFVGCGDRRYEPYYFCEGIEILKREWLKVGGQQLGETLKIQGEAYEVLDTLVQPWAEGLVPFFTSNHQSTPVQNLGLASRLQKAFGLSN
jgi:flavodoxin